MKFTVCVPTLNASETWTAFSRALNEQTARPEEVLIIDSGSKDGTAELSEESGFRIVRIPPSEFRHGATRQLAAEIAAECDVLVFLTQDAILADANAIASLLQAFEDPTVGAAYGRQLPRKGAGSIEAHARLFNYPRVSGLRNEESMPSLGFKTIFFSNSFGAYRRQALSMVGGFTPELDFGEDTVAAAKLIGAGWKIAYVAEAQVVHSHAHSLRQEFDRYRLIGQLHAKQAQLLEPFGRASGEGLRFLRSEIQYLALTAPHLIPSALMRTGCKYLGYRMGLRSRECRAATPISEDPNSS